MPPGEKQDELTPEQKAAAEAEAALKPPDGYTEEEWSGLSDTEKEGIRDSIKNPEGGEEEEVLDEAALAAIAKEGETPEEKTAREAKEADDAAAAPPAKAPEEIAAEAAAAKPPAILPDEDLLRFNGRNAVLDSELKVEDVVPSEVQTKIDALDAKYEAGEVDLKAYNRERDALNREVWTANQTVRDEARTAKAWEKEQSFFFLNRPEYMEKDAGGKYLPKSSAMFGAFKETVSRLNADPMYANTSGMELLLAADKAVKEAFGITKIVPAGKPPAAAPGKPPAARPTLKTLADVPAAAVEDTSGDPFSALDRLTGESYEKALEKLTEPQREAYLSGASKPSRVSRG
jgi:hypothetical protein